MKKIILLLACIIAQHGFSQPQKKIDSLVSVLKTLKEDTNKVITLNALAKAYMRTSDFDQSKKNANEALRLSEKINFKKGKGRAYLNFGLIDSYQGNYPEALKNYIDGLKIMEEIKNKNGIGDANYRIGIIYQEQGKYSESVTHLQVAMKIWEETGNKASLADCLNEIGVIYSRQGNYEEALKNQLAGLKLREEIGDKLSIAYSYNNIGEVYRLQHNYPEALKNALESLKIKEAIGDKYSIASSYMNIGSIYMYQGNNSLALKNYLVALKMKEELGDKHGIAACYCNAGIAQGKLGNNAEAIKNIHTALKIAEEIGTNDIIITSYVSLGEIYLKLKNYQEANEYLNKALARSKEIGLKEAIAETYFSISDMYDANGSYKQSLEHYKLYTIYKDSMLNETSGRQITEMKTKYETEKKDAEIIILNKDKEVKDAEINKQKTLKYSFIAGLAGLAFLTLIAFNNIRVRNKLKLQTLRNKIASDLHDDVGSTLSSIAIFTDIAKQQTSEVTPMLEQIGDSSRKMLDAMADIVWTINPENDQFEKIILRMRSFAYELLGAKKIEFEFEADDDVTKMKLPMDVRKNLYLIFKEATNNMVKYSGASKASFLIHGEKNNFTMLIRDNGNGFDISKEYIGNGLKNMRRRAEEIGAKLLLESELGKGTTIQLLLSLA